MLFSGSVNFYEVLAEKKHILGIEIEGRVKFTISLLSSDFDLLYPLNGFSPTLGTTQESLPQ